MLIRFGRKTCGAAWIRTYHDEHGLRGRARAGSDNGPGIPTCPRQSGYSHLPPAVGLFAPATGSCSFQPDHFNPIISTRSRGAIYLSEQGRALDNVFVERLCRSLKYEEVYLHEYRSVKEAREGIDGYIKFYNEKRPHQSLDNRTPCEVHFNIPRGKGLLAPLPVPLSLGKGGAAPFANPEDADGVGINYG